MSLFDWRIAKKQVQNGYNFGYGAAIEHYSNLKRRMFDQLSVDKSLMNDSFYIDIEKQLKQELNELSQGVSNNLSSLSYDSLNKIQQMVINVFENNSDGGLLNELTQQLVQLENNKELTQSTRKQEIEKIRQQILNYFGKENIQKIAQDALASYTGGSGDLGVIYSFLNSFLINTIRWYTNSQSKNLFINKNALTTLMGYYKEIIEVKLLQQLFSQMQAKGISKSVNIDLVAGKNTINDIIFSFLSPFESNSVNTAVSLSSIGEEYENYIGAQIKSRDIEKVKTDFMKISHQAGLRDKFNQGMISPAGRFSQYSWSCGVAFLGQTENILQSLGINNVMFISGATRDFTDNFIRNFRSKNMYLAFEFDAQHKATSQVGLQRYVENKGRNQILARFR